MKHNELYDLIQKNELKVHIDHTVIGTNTVKENLLLIQRVFKRLEENKVYINFKKRALYFIKIFRAYYFIKSFRAKYRKNKTHSIA